MDLLHESAQWNAVAKNKATTFRTRPGQWTEQSFDPECVSNRSGCFCFLCLRNPKIRRESFTMRRGRRRLFLMVYLKSMCSFSVALHHWPEYGPNTVIPSFWIGASTCVECQSSCTIANLHFLVQATKNGGRTGSSAISRTIRLSE
jgi:hypothetical protein